MRAYNSIRKFVGGAVVGLAAFVSGGCPGVGVGVNVIPANIYDFNIVNTETCEEDAKGDKKVAEWKLSEECADVFQTNGIGAEVEGDGPFPFDLSARGQDTDGNGSLETWALYVKDNGNQLPVGEKKLYNLQVRSSSNVAWTLPMGGLPPWSLPLVNFTGNGFDVRDFGYTNCVADESEPPYTIGDGVCDAAHGEHYGNSPVDCGNDNFCDTVNGENFANSPQDCRGDGFCDTANGENYDNSPGDCPPPEEPCVSACTIGSTECFTDNSLRVCSDNGNGCGVWSPPVTCSQDYTCQGGSCVFNPDQSQDRAYTAINFAGTPIDPVSNPRGHLNNPVTNGELVARTYIPVALEDFLLANFPGVIVSNSIEEHGYTGPGDCFYISNTGSMTRVGEQDGFGIWQRPFELTRNYSCGSGDQPMETIWAGTTLYGYPNPDDVVADTELATVHP